MKRLALILGLVVFVFSACDLYDYGETGGADKTETLSPGDPLFERVMSSLSGVWYSHYAGIGRLDGYRTGTWDDFDDLVETPGKTGLFPNLAPPYKTYTAESGSDVPAPGHYFVLYDDTVYGQEDDSSPSQESWGFSYCGIVRAVNVFNGDPDRGAVIIEYLKGCAPQWDEDIKDGQRPFFGIYYKVLDRDTVQLANAVDLAAKDKGEDYYTETEHLNEALGLNTVENEAEFISWGVVIPQNREP
jgi:hypothetical protein